MRHAVRLALLWFLALALPAQGIAAATRVACDLERRAPVSAAPAGLPSPIRHMAHMGHRHGADGGAHGQAGAGAGASSKPHPADAGTQKCSAGALCCLNAAVFSTAATFDPVDSIDAVVAFVPRALTAPVAEGLERPPRAVPRV